MRRPSGATPGSSTLSRTAAPTIVIAPASSNAPSATSPAARDFASGRRPVATAMTGTSTTPVPSEPSTVTRTLYEPSRINHRAALYSVASPGTRWATSGGGGAAVMGSQYTGRTSTRCTERGASRRTLIWTRPGTTPGFRTMIRTGYGPAAPSK